MIIAITPTIPNITAAATNGIHSGLVTHHQLQSMVPVNFKTRNTMNKIIPIPIPFDLFSFAILFSLIQIVYLIILL